jgi:hypothetical protein
VHLGVCLGDIIDANLTWCASDGNAGAHWTKFTREIDKLGTFVDYDLLCQFRWDNTDDDTNRQSRRAAEILVHGHVPVELISWVCSCNEKTMTQAESLLNSVGGVRNYRAKPEMFYL